MLLLNQTGQTGREQLGEMGKIRDGQVVARRIGDERARPDGHHERAKRLHAGVVEMFRLDRGQHVTGVLE